MNAGPTTALTIGISVLIAVLSGCSTAGPHAAIFGTGTKQHFDDYLQQCGTNEIRCLWFLQDDPRTGMVMTIQLDGKTVNTARDVYGWAEQDSATNKLDDVQVFRLQQMISTLPAPDNNSPYASSVFISIRDGQSARIFQYDRHYTPAVIWRIYDVAGGYFYADEDD